MHLDASSDAAPTMSGCTTPLGSISGTSTLQGTWTDECVSSNRRGTRYARYFTFELATAAELTIELVSEIDPYLYLMAGAGTSGTELAKNDDSRDFAFGYSDSRITYEAAAGTYTAEATTYGSRRTGDFTFTIDAVPSIPSAPTNVSVVPGNNRLVVLWDAPASDGGSPVTGYRVEQEVASGSQSRSTRSIVDPSRLLGVDDRGYAILDLANGTEYSVTVKAVNANGDGAPSTALRRTPQENISISIGTVTPNPLVLARKATVNATISNTVSGVDYSAELVIQDTDKIRFGDCDDDRVTQPLPNLGSTVRIQACETGTPTISARLLVDDAANRTYKIAESLPRRVTVDAAPERLEIYGLAGIDGEFDQGEEKSITITGSDLVRNVEYDVDVETSEGDSAALGFGTSCGISTAVDNFESATGRDDAIFNLRGCMAIAGVTINADLQLDGVLVATAFAIAHVRPSIPSDVRANGRGSMSDEAYVRFAPVDRAQAYETSFSTDNVTWSVPHRHNPGASDYLTFGTVRAVQLTVDQLPVDQVVQVRVRSVRTDGTSTVKSEVRVNDWVAVWVAQSALPPGATYRDPLDDGIYSYTVCAGDGFGPATDQLYQNWRDDIDAGIASWETGVKWIKSDGNNIMRSQRVSTGDCADGREHVSNVVNGISDQATFQLKCFGPGPYTRIQNRAIGCVEPGDNQVRSIFFWTNGASWNPGSGTSTTCSYATTGAAHESGHAFGHWSHLTDTRALMHASPSRNACKPGPKDVMALMALYQRTAN